MLSWTGWRALDGISTINLSSSVISLLIDAASAVNLSRFTQLLTLKFMNMTTKIVVLSAVGLLGAAAAIHHSGICPMQKAKAAFVKHTVKPPAKDATATVAFNK
jgi:hypothetical protein